MESRLDGQPSAPSNTVARPKCLRIMTPGLRLHRPDPSYIGPRPRTSSNPARYADGRRARAYPSVRAAAPARVHQPDPEYTRAYRDDPDCEAFLIADQEMSPADDSSTV